MYQLIGKDSDAGKKTEGKRRRGWQRMRWLDNITDSMDMNLSTISRTEEPGVLESMGLRRVGQDFSDRTTITRSDCLAQRCSADFFPAKSPVSFLTKK